MASRIIALDYGRRRIGTAITDPLGITVQFLPALVVRGSADAVERIDELLSQYECGRVVLGLPRTNSGALGDAAKGVQKFGALLERRLNVQVEYFDERYTTKRAERAMREMGVKPSRNKEKVDSLSAVFILQDYLEFHGI